MRAIAVAVYSSEIIKCNSRENILSHPMHIRRPSVKHAVSMCLLFYVQNRKGCECSYIFKIPMLVPIKRKVTVTLQVKLN